MKYEKFEEWMFHAPVVTSNGKKGVVADHRYGAVYIDFKDGTALWWSLWDVEFLEESLPNEEDVSIPWEVGQVVWCLFAGKGRVISVDEGNFDPVQVEFDDGGYMTYGYDGGKSGYDFRCLFFSEPKIIADTMPPKKPFVPKLKEGDEVVTWFEDGSKYFIVVREETLTAVIDDNGDSFLKSETRFLKIGEEIKFEEDDL